MIETRKPETTSDTCESCDRPAVVVLVVKSKAMWARSTPLCERCQRDVARCLSPGMPSKKDLQTVWDMAQEMSGENSYGAFDKETGVRLGVFPPIAEALNRVRKFFKLKGKDLG